MRGKNHTQKSQMERKYYNTIIRKEDYSPTINEKLDFKNSDNPEYDSIEEVQSTSKRPPSTSYLIIEHFKEHWLKWLSGIIIAFLGFIIFTISYDLGKIEEGINFLKENNKEINKKIDLINDINNKQELKIQKNEIDVDYLKNPIKNELNKH